MSAQVSNLPPWQHERDLRDDKSGIAIQVYTRTMEPRHSGDPPLVHRSYQICSVDQLGQIRRYFHARVSVDRESGLVTVEPFPVDALRALVLQMECDHVRDRQEREERTEKMRKIGRGQVR